MRTHQRFRFRAPVAALVTTAAVTVAGCDQGRSTAAFCDTLRSEQQRIRAQFDESVDGEVESLEEALLGIGASIQAIGELETYFSKLAKVAPAEIQTEAEIVAEGYGELLDESRDSLDNPLGAMFGSVMGSMQLSGSMATLDDFAVEHCDTHL